MGSCCDSRDTVTVFLTRAFSGPQAVIPESSLSPHSNLSVPSNPAQSTQLQSSYNPFEDEDDTGSSVSEKEDIKAKKLVNTHFPLASTLLSVSLLSIQGSLGVSPLSTSAVHGSCRTWAHSRPAGTGSGLSTSPLWEGTANTLGCFFSVPC